VNESSKKADLVEVAKSLGLNISGKKSDLIERIQSYRQRHSLSDDNFTTPRYSQSNALDNSLLLPACYPEKYEGLLGIEELRQKNMLLVAPSNK